MAGSRFEPDRGLTSRMLMTMFLLGLVYVVFMAALIALRIPWLLLLIIVVGFGLFQYFASDKIALFSMNAREVSPEQAPDLHAVIDRLCAQADMSKPRVAIADTDVPNAFATGRSEKASVICVTTGLLRRVDLNELEGVLAHELSHVAHRDVAVMTIASFLGLLAGIVTRFGLQFGLFGGGRGRDNNTFLIFMLTVLISAIVYAISFLLTRALSRYRELAADRAAALLTGRPSALASALTKISGDMARIPTRDLRKAEPMNAFFFAPAISRGFSLSSLFSTHPPLERRLEQLAQISRQLGKGA
ncbi:MAG: zinc metalloprotease HtpX [Streptosporangiales bacterium]|nr:zinc metalloprotease HtpX [Streptosporangiales bacterium]